ncbi:unnamed protein product [Cunninghamella echinulata]
MRLIRFSLLLSKVFQSMINLIDYNNNISINNKQQYQDSIDYSLLANQTYYPSPTPSPHLNSPTSLMFNDMQQQQQQQQPQETFQIASSMNDWSLDGFYNFDSLNYNNYYQNNNNVSIDHGLSSPPPPPPPPQPMMFPTELSMNQWNHDQQHFIYSPSSSIQDQTELDSTISSKKKNNNNNNNKPCKKKSVPYANNLVNLNFNLSSSSSSSTKSLSSSPKIEESLFTLKNQQQEEYVEVEIKNKKNEVVKKNNSCLSATTSISLLTPKPSHQCDYPGCNKTFTRSYNLKSHMRSHLNEKPYECDLCTKKFARQHDRDRHKKIHLGIKPFICMFCLKTFARQDALSRHQKWSPTSSNNEYDYPICSTLKRKNRKKQ